MHAIAVVALCIQMVGSYLIWPSRWNIPAHLALGFCVTAYIVPGLATDVWGLFDDQTSLLYTGINVVGAIAMIVGLVLGSRLDWFKSFTRRLQAIYVDPVAQEKALKRIERVSLLAILGMIAAYAIMGFIPMFAADPFSAKQFKNEYYEPYYRAAYLFRASFSILTVIIPLVMTAWWVTKRPKPLVFGISAMLLIAISLARQSTATGLLTFLGFLAARTRRGTFWYLILTTIIFPLGSAAYLLLGLALGVESLTSIYSLDSVADIVSSGAPDIYDQLSLLTGFRETLNFTYGKTFFGGLLPGNYMWNPSVWTVTYDSLGSDISDIVTGGLRLSAAMWGFCSFSWIGVVLVPFFSGVLNAAFIGVLKKLPKDSSLVATALAMSLYTTLGKQLYEFYFLSIHNIPSIFCSLFLAFGSAFFLSRRRRSVDLEKVLHVRSR